MDTKLSITQTTCCRASLFSCPVACGVVHFGPMPGMTRCETARLYDYCSSQNRLQLSALQSYHPHSPIDKCPTSCLQAGSSCCFVADISLAHELRL